MDGVAINQVPPINQMGYIVTPPASGEPVTSLNSFLTASGAWHEENNRPNRGMLSDLWYRGVAEHYPHQAPGVYRRSFSERAKHLVVSGGLENKRLYLERYMISQFRTAGAPFLEGYSTTQVYFAAQHYGMPTRLLDWSTNPLAALFFACNEAPSEDGFVYAMDAGKIIPDTARARKGQRLYQTVMTMRNKYVEEAIGLSFWDEPASPMNPFVLPVRPDAAPGRIAQQSSCFTLHMHEAASASNPTMITIKVAASSKGTILKELHRANINQFTTYYDLDHLSKEIIAGWGC
ncbi:MAG: FRG domain-containing protein [Bryobacteraceae bacterium]|jgi:hypothetical protein